MVPENLTRPWSALGVRLSVFSVEPREAPDDLWGQVVGGLPETDQNQPRQRVRMQAGPWHEGVLQLTVSPFNIVWLASPPAEEEGLPKLDNWHVTDVLQEFLAVTGPSLDLVDFRVKRIGFGLHSVLSAEDRFQLTGCFKVLFVLQKSSRKPRPISYTKSIVRSQVECWAAKYG